MESWLFDLIRSLVEVSLGFIVPSVLVCLFIAIVVGLLQSFTNIKDELISYAGKLVGVFAVILIFSGAFAESLKDLAVKAWSGGFAP